MTFDAQTIMAIAALLTVISNFFLALRADKKLGHIVTLTNGQSEKLNAVSKALGHAEGMAEEKRKA